MTRPVRIVVERLVLDGLDLPADGADAVARALSDELGRLVVDALPTRSATAASVPAPGVTLPAGAPPTELGRQVGGAVHTAVHGTAHGAVQGAGHERGGGRS